MSTLSSASRGPARRDAGSKKFSDEGRERLRAAALTNRPWAHSRGPVTAEGKARSAQNGRSRQRNEVSRRELKAELAGIFDLIREMQFTRRSLS